MIWAPFKVKTVLQSAPFPDDIKAASFPTIPYKALPDLPTLSRVVAGHLHFIGAPGSLTSAQATTQSFLAVSMQAPDIEVIPPPNAEIGGPAQLGAPLLREVPAGQNGVLDGEVQPLMHIGVPMVHRSRIDGIVVTKGTTCPSFT